MPPEVLLGLGLDGGAQRVGVRLHKRRAVDWRRRGAVGRGRRGRATLCEPQQAESERAKQEALERQRAAMQEQQAALARQQAPLEQHKAQTEAERALQAQVAALQAAMQQQQLEAQRAMQEALEEQQPPAPAPAAPAAASRPMSAARIVESFENPPAPAPAPLTAPAPAPVAADAPVAAGLLDELARTEAVLAEERKAMEDGMAALETRRPPRSRLASRRPRPPRTCTSRRFQLKCGFDPSDLPSARERI